MEPNSSQSERVLSLRGQGHNGTSRVRGATGAKRGEASGAKLGELSEASGASGASCRVFLLRAEGRAAPSQNLDP